MLDVHAPEHPISGPREFFFHLFTITCGLLIALALENTAEALHHRHERREAEESIRQELAANRDAAKGLAPVIAKQRSALLTILTFVETRSEGKRDEPPSNAGFDFSEYEIPDAAWRTASSTGVLSYMDYAEVQRFSAAYREQELLQKQEQEMLSDMLLLGTFIRPNEPIKDLDQQGATAALPYLRKAVGDFSGILAVGAGTLAAYDEALK